MSITRELAQSVRSAIYFHPDMRRDLLLASYPRSGNTWLRAICFHAVVGREGVNLAELDRAVIDIHALPRRSQAMRLQRYVVKTHFPARYDQEINRALCVVRDPRDLIPSYYRYTMKSSNSQYNFEQFCGAVLHGSKWPCSWYENTRSWMHYQECHPEKVDFVRYDRLVAREPFSVDILARFLGRPAEQIDGLMALYDFDKMKVLEKGGRRDGMAGDKSQWFVGQGKASEDQYAVVDRMIRAQAPHYIDVMQKFGFEG